MVRRLGLLLALLAAGVGCTASQSQESARSRSQAGTRVAAAATAAQAPARTASTGSVLAPWTPVRGEVRGAGVEFTCSDRRYQFDRNGFLAQVTSVGAAMLSRPMELRIRVDGAEPEWTYSAPQITERTPAVVRWTQEMSAPELTVRFNYTAEYDGMVRMDWSVDPRRDCTLDEISLLFPLRTEHARYFWYHLDNRGHYYMHRPGLVENAPSSMGFDPVLWLGDEDRGLMWVAESEEYWFPRSPRKCVTTERAGEETRLRLEIVSLPVRLQPGAAPGRGRTFPRLEYTMGLQATPLQPGRPDSWDDRTLHMVQRHYGYGIEKAPAATTGQIDYPAIPNIQLERGTVELWVNPQFDPAAKMPTNRPVFDLKLEGTKRILLNWDTTEPGLRLLMNDGRDWVVAIPSTQRWRRGEWHHVAFTWGDAARLYVGGRLVGERPHRGSIAGSLGNRTITLGGPDGDWAYDHLVTSSVARSAQEIAQRARSAVAPDGATLLLDRMEPQTPLARGAEGRKSPSARYVAGQFGSAVEPSSSGSVLDSLADAGVKTLVFHEHWTDIEGHISTTHGAELRSLIQAAHRRGMKVVIYFGGWISEISPEWSRQGRDWRMLRDSVMAAVLDTPPQPKQNYWATCPNSGWQDYVVRGIQQVLREYDADGVYMDGPTISGGCWNTKHGCGFPAANTANPSDRIRVADRDQPQARAYVTPDGRTAATFPVWELRETFRRIYTVVKQHRPAGSVQYHLSGFLSPAMAYSTVYWDGEQLHPGPNQSPQDRLPPDLFRAELMGWNWGVAADFMEYNLRIPPVQGWAFTLPHDVPRRPDSAEEVGLASNIWRVMDRFGRREAEWLPYWSNGSYVSSTPGTVYTSLYRHPRGDVLAAVSNLGEREERASVRLRADRLGLPAGATATDAITGEPLPLTGGALSFGLKPLEWRLVWIKR